MMVRLSVDPLDPRDVPALIGAADPTFGGGNGYVASVATGTNQFNAALVQPDGKIVLAGTTDAANPANADLVIVRLNPDGTPDRTFNGTGRVVVPSFAPGSDDEATAVVRQSTGGLVVGGFTNKNGSYDFAAVRVSAAGVFDPTFGTNGFAILGGGGVDKAYALAVGADDRLVLAGSANGTDSMGLVRLSASGQPDASFNGGALRLIQLGTGQEEARAAAVYADNTVLLAGWRTAAGATDTVALRVSADGKFVAANFGKDSYTGPTEIVPFARLDAGGEDKGLAAQLLPDNRFVVAGYATVNGARQFAVSRFTALGVPDATFGTDGLFRVGLGGTDDQATAVVVQPDGRPVAAGFSNVGGAYQAVAVRLTAAGALDPSFDGDGAAGVPFGATAGGNDRGLAVARDAQGRIVVAGRSAGSGAANRLVGTLGLPTAVVAGGPADGTGVVLSAPKADGSGYDATSARLVTFFTNFTGTVRTAAADVTGDGVPDLIAVTGPGAAPVLTVRDGVTDAVLAQPFLVFEQSFTGGLFVSAVDLTGDGRAEVIVTPDQGGGPIVAVYDGAALAGGFSSGSQLARFYGIQDANFRGGARTAVGDVTGDGIPDLAVAAGFGGGPRVALYDGRTVLDALPAASGTLVPVPPKLVPDFFVFEDNLRNGVFVAVGDLDADGRADLWFGGGPGGGPRVRVASGRQLLATGTIARLDDAPAGVQLANFFAGDPNARGGVPLAVRDLDGDGDAALAAASGQGQAARLLVYRGTTVRATASPAADQALDLFGGGTLATGVYVG